MGYVFEKGHGAGKRSAPAHVYGVTWAGTSSTALTRTDDAAGFAEPVPYVSGATSYSSPFDDCMPWKGMVRVTDASYGEMVEIPKFWYKLTKSGSALSIQIADGEQDGFHVSPAHMDRGDGAGERDVVYIGRYHVSNSTGKSTTGSLPRVQYDRERARAIFRILNNGYWLMDFAMRFTIWLLYIVEFADWNSQGKIGLGCGYSRALENMGYTDSMPYHTGTTLTLRTTNGFGTQYRYIEGLWDNCYDWVDGCYYNSSGMNIILNPSNFSDSENGTSIGTPSNGLPTALSISTAVFPMFYPTASGGSTGSYIPDQWYFNSSYPQIAAGGSYISSKDDGLFYLRYHQTNTDLNYIGCRLMKLP